MPRFQEPKAKLVITDKEARRVREVARNARKSGTPFDQERARHADKLVDDATVIHEN